MISQRIVYALRSMMHLEKKWLTGLAEWSVTKKNLPSLNSYSKSGGTDR
jgi:hypothetical protein